MTTTTIADQTDLERWVETATAHWQQRNPGDIASLVNAILADEDRPAFGADWSAYLDSIGTLPEYLD